MSITAKDYLGQPFGEGARVRGLHDSEPYTAIVRIIMPAANDVRNNRLVVTRDDNKESLETFSDAVTVLDRYHPVPHRPIVRFTAPDGGSSPIEATLRDSGKVSVISDPDSGHLNGAWLTPTELREFATELLGLADVAETLYGDET